MENTTNASVIAKRNNAGIKAQRTGAIALIILGALMVVLGIAGAITIDDALPVIAILLGVGVVCAVPGIILLVVLNKQKDEEGAPAILLSADNTTLTLCLGKGKQQDIQVADITRIKFVPRRSAQYLGIVTRYVTHPDGTLVFYTKDGNKYKVPCVDQAETVVDLINSYRK